MKCEIHLKRGKPNQNIPPKQELKILNKNNGESAESLTGNSGWLYRGRLNYTIQCMYINCLTSLNFYLTLEKVFCELALRFII